MEVKIGNKDIAVKMRTRMECSFGKRQQKM